MCNPPNTQKRMWQRHCMHNKSIYVINIWQIYVKISVCLAPRMSMTVCVLTCGDSSGYFRGQERVCLCALHSHHAFCPSIVLFLTTGLRWQVVCFCVANLSVPSGRGSRILEPVTARVRVISVSLL